MYPLPIQIQIEGETWVLLGGYVGLLVMAQVTNLSYAAWMLSRQIRLVVK